jgi:peroxiredoxin
MELAGPRRTFFRPPDSAAPARSILCATLALLFFSGCGREEPIVEEPAPAGIIQEIKGEKSITTDVNARSPAFARETMGDGVVRTQDFIGRQVLLLDFWSVFCQSCLEEIPFLLELYRDYHDQGLEIVSINTDFFPKARIISFMEKTGIDLPFPLVFDRDQSLSKLFQVDALPVTVLIDSSGWIRMVHLGYRPSDKKLIESRVRKACRKIKETVVTLQPVDGRTAFAPPESGTSFLKAGSMAPEFSAADTKGSRISFSELRGDSPAAIFFWSLFCQPCREEFPLLADLARRGAPRGLKSFSVNLDAPKLLPAAVKFARKKGDSLVALFDSLPDGESAGAASSFGVHYTPSIFLVAGDGTIQFSASGEIAPTRLEEEMESLLSRSVAGEDDRGEVLR